MLSATKAFTRIVAALAVVSATTLPFTPSASAQTPPTDAASVSVSPPTTELTIEPGKKANAKITLTNGSSFTRTFSVKVQNFTASGETGQADLSEEEGPYSLRTWVQVSPQRVDIEPAKTQDFNVEINVPEKASPGGHFGAVVFTPTVSPDANANVSVVSEVSSLFLIRVPGDAIEKASLASFKAQSLSGNPEAPTKKDASFFKEGPVNFSVRVKNDGNVQLKPKSTITVTNIFGKEIDKIDVPAQTVLPESIRNYEVKWDQKHLLGKYKVSVKTTYGAPEQTLTASTTFWAAPVGLAIGAAVAAIAAFLFLWLPRKRLRKAFKALTAKDE